MCVSDTRLLKETLGSADMVKKEKRTLVTSSLRHNGWIVLSRLLGDGTDFFFLTFIPFLQDDINLKIWSRWFPPLFGEDT